MKPMILLALMGILVAEAAPAQVASKIRITPDGGPLYATIESNEKKIADAAFKAWLMENGRSVVYSTPDGAGGFENEGQALYRFDIASGRRTKIMSEYFEITDLEPVVSASGKVAYLVSMQDGGLGASHIAVVDPRKGEVFEKDGAKFVRSSPAAFTVAWYKDDDWDKLRNNVDIRPYKTKQYDLDDVLRRSVIINKPSR